MFELDENISLNITIIEEIYESTLQSIFCKSKSIFSLLNLAAQ